jgi:hypothetical protein
MHQKVGRAKLTEVIRVDLPTPSAEGLREAVAVKGSALLSRAQTVGAGL